jgi:hypothetical protein
MMQSRRIFHQLARDTRIMARLHELNQQVEWQQLLEEMDPDARRRAEACRAEYEARREVTPVRQSYRDAVAPVLADLAESGFPVRTIDDLKQHRVSYGDAVPILVRWLSLTDDPDVKLTITHALNVPWRRREVTRALVSEFKRVADSRSYLKWALGDTLATVFDSSSGDDILDLVQDRRHGRARQMLVGRLGKLRDPRVIDVLIDLLGDDDVVLHALTAIGRRRAQEARARVTLLLDNPNRTVRRAAHQVLTRLDEALPREGDRQLYP